MKNALLIFICLFITLVTVQAEEGKVEEKKEIISFEIMVIDANTEEPIPAAKIIIDQKEVGTYTNFDGIVKLDDMLKGSHDIEITFISYQKQQYKAFVLDESNSRLLVKLQP